MSYTKQNFASKQKLKADHMNHIEEGIANSVPVSRIVAGVLRFDGSNWTILNNEGHIPINITGINGNTPDQFTITFPSYLKVNSLVATPDETLAAAGIKCGASVGVDYATVHLKQDRNVRIMVTGNENGTGATVTRYETDDRTDVSGFSAKIVENATLGNYVRVEDSKGNIDGKALPTFGGSFNSTILGSKSGYTNVQLRTFDGTVSDYKNVQFQMSWSLLNASPVFTDYELSKGNIWVFGIMEEGE